MCALYHPPPRLPTPSAAGRGGGVEPPTKFSKIGALRGSQILEWCCRERGGDFFQDGVNRTNMSEVGGDNWRPLCRHWFRLSPSLLEDASKTILGYT